VGSGVKGYINNIMDELYFVYDLDDDDDDDDDNNNNNNNNNNKILVFHFNTIKMFYFMTRCWLLGL